MPRFLPVGKDAKGAAAFLLAALPALGALLTALAITGDLVGRMARNHPAATFAAFGCAALAVFLGAVGAFAFTEGSTEERSALRLGIAVLAGALVFGVYAGVETWGDHAQPSITVRPKGSALLIAVHSTGLRSQDHVVVEVEQLIRAPDDRGRLTWKPGLPLFGASLGPDSSGEIKDAIDVPVPAGDFDDIGARAWVGREPKPCYGSSNTTGCVRVHLPRLQERPQLAADWETFVRVPRLLIRLRARNLAHRPARAMTLRVFGVAPGGASFRTLAEWSLAPSATGEFDRRLSVVVGRAYADVCVVASLSTRTPACPPRVDDGTVWLRLAVPPTQ